MNVGRLLSGLSATPGKLLVATGSAAGQIVGGFLGAVARTREQVRLAGTYHDAARRDRTTRDWRADLASADQAILDELDTMLARSRMAIANDGWAASTQGAFGRYVVGGGITARATARHPETGERLGGFNRQCNLLWEERCCDPRLCDAEETKTMPEKQRVWMNELVAAGGVFVVEQYLPNTEATRLLLQEVEYEQRDQLRREYNGRAVRGGIELGDRHEPIAYHLHQARHPLDDYATDSVRIEAENVHHVYRQDRVLQRIGTPWMRPVLPAVRGLAMYQRYTMIQARGRAAHVGFIKQAQSSGAGDTPAAMAARIGAKPASAATSEESDELRVNLAPGVYPLLKPGQEPYFPNPQTPDTMYPPFVLEHLKQISAGTGLDVATVSRWYADGNFSSQRQAKLDIHAEIDWIQDLLFIHRICRRDRRHWMELAIREGRLPATGFFESPRWRAAYLSTNWQGPPRPSIDRIKDSAAWDMEIKAGRASPQEYCNEMGKDPEQVLSEIREFREIAEQQGVLDVVDAWLGTSVANAPKEGRRPADPTPPEGGNGDAAATAGRGLADLVVRQHVLNSLLDEGEPAAAGGNGRRL